MNNNPSDGWVKVTKGFKQANKEHVTNNVKKTVQYENKYELPKCLEKKLHLNSSISTMFNGNKNKSKVSPDDKNLKCHKRNQRRNAKRKKKRMEKAKSKTNKEKDISNLEIDTSNALISLPSEVWADNILPFLPIADLASLGSCNKQGKGVSEDIHHWQSRFHAQFPMHNINFISDMDYKLAHKLHTTGAIEKHRCFHSKKTCFEDVLGLGVDFTVNPKTKKVDYIRTGQDLLSATAFKAGTKSDAFGNHFKLFLPLYFSQDHFERALPSIISTLCRLVSEKPAFVFEPNMILDVLPKIINTFAVLISDEGVAASKKSIYGLIRIHRLFLALVEKFPSIKTEAIRRIQTFHKVSCKTSCPSLGNFLPLLLIVDDDAHNWVTIRSKYISESLTRKMLWVCKAYPELQRTEDTTPSDIDQRLKLTREASRVGTRLNMLQVHFVSFLCQGTNRSRALRLDSFLEDLEPEDVQNATIVLPEYELANEVQDQQEAVTDENHKDDTNLESQKHGAELSLSSTLSFSTFRLVVNEILTVDSWMRFFEFMRAPCPKSKLRMAEILRNAVKESARKKYHTPGMDFARVHASGTSRILSKGQKFTASGLQRVVFSDNWTFEGDTKFFDATCLVYKNKKLTRTVDYMQQGCEFIRHSGDVMGDGTGSHTIHLDLSRMDSDVTSCIFVLSAWSEATLLDITSASVSFTDANAGDSALCTYNLDAHDKVSHLKSIIMCKLYRTDDGRWHVLAIGDSYGGSADNYRPIYTAAKKYL